MHYAQSLHKNEGKKSYLPNPLFLYFADLAIAASGHGGYCEDGVPTEAALLAILAAFAVSFAILYMASTTNTGRKKREISLSDMLKDVMWSGK